MNNVKKIVLLFLVLLIVGAIWFYKLSSEVEIIPTNEITRVFNFANGSKIYIRAKVWGVAGNHEEIAFSENPITIADKEKDYIFYTDEVLYKIDKNILTLYAPQSGGSISKIPFKDVEIIFKGLKKADEIRDYSINYKKYGLQRISVYR